MKISLQGIVSGLGQQHQGLELAPDVLRKHGIVDILSKNSEVLDLGNIHPNNDAWKLIDHVSESSLQALDSCRLLITIGGDHSISMGTIDASLKMYPRAKVLWIDAHGDINTPQTSISGNLHGMPLAGLLGLFPIEKRRGPKLLPENLFIVGVRDLDLPEINFLKDLKIQHYSSEDVNKDPILILKKIYAWINDGSGEPVHLSFDIDSLDPRTAPATGTRVPNGLSLEFVKSLVKQVAESGFLISVDLVEFNPSLAVNPQELALTIESVMSVISTASASFHKNFKLM